MDIITDIRTTTTTIPITEVEKKVEMLIPALYSENIPWLKGIDIINDVVHLRDDKRLLLSKEPSSLILDWIKQKYTSDLFLHFSGAYSEEEIEKENIVKTLEATLNTLLHLDNRPEILSFILKIRKKSSSQFETFLLDEFTSNLKYKIEYSKKRLSDSISSQVINRANTYLKERFESHIDEKLLCALKDTINEHKLSYSMGFCIKKEEHISPLKRSRLIGLGALFISKETNLIKIAGSGPLNWVEWFELKIEGLEIYWILEINYSPKKISSLKTLLNKNTKELLKTIENGKISIEDELYILENIHNDLNNANIDSVLSKHKRPIVTVINKS